MIPFARRAFLTFALAGAMSLGYGQTGRADDAGLRDIPPAFAPFEFLVGRWNGQGVPKENAAQQFRGWPETHSWAWIFTEGKPAGLAVTIEGGKLLASGKLTYDPARKLFRLDGLEPKPVERPIAFEGSFDSAKKTLVLERVAPAKSLKKDLDKLRVTLRPNANFIRYTITADRQQPGAVQYTRTFEVGLTKEGESFAAGAAAAADRPKCIVTGGAAALSVTYEGRTFPICCTGCRDEFNDNPEKYVKKAALLASAPKGSAKAKSAASSSVSRSDDPFAGDVVDADHATAVPAKKKMPATKAAKQSDQSTGGDPAPATDSKAKSKNKPSATKVTEPPAAAKQATRAAALLRLGTNLEKSGKTTAAMTYFRQIVKDYAGTPSAKTAAERIKAIEKE